jgi:uncharacterized protein (DUF58 family)
MLKPGAGEVTVSVDATLAFTNDPLVPVTTGENVPVPPPLDVVTVIVLVPDPVHRRRAETRRRPRRQPRRLEAHWRKAGVLVVPVPHCAFTVHWLFRMVVFDPMGVC